MSKPAAKLGAGVSPTDPLVSTPVPNVLINGTPAMVTPGTVTGINVVGPVPVGSMTVMINSMPAIRMGDMLTGATHPISGAPVPGAAIVFGCSMNVLIGG